MQNVTDDLSGLNHPRPCGDAGNPYPAFGEVALTAFIQGFNHAARAVVDERSIVGHDHDEGVFGNALFFKVFLQLSYKNVKAFERFLQGVLVGGSLDGVALIRNERKQNWLMGDKKRFLGFHSLIDEIILLSFEAPKSYTTENVIEIQCHGGYKVTQKILELCMTQGCRLAEKGEFTKRAFLGGRIDLTQVEAVLDIIRSKIGSSGICPSNRYGYT